MTVITSIYSDGGCVGYNPAHTGTWAWCHVDEDGTRIEWNSGYVQRNEFIVGPVTNNLTEFVALLYGIEALPAHWSGRVCSDSGVTLGRFFAGWGLKGIPATLERRMHLAVQRLGNPTPILHDGHPTSEQLRTGVGRRGHVASIHLVWCDRECSRLAEQERMRRRGKGRR